MRFQKKKKKRRCSNMHVSSTCSRYCTGVVMTSKHPRHARAYGPPRPRSQARRPPARQSPDRPAGLPTGRRTRARWGLGPRPPRRGRAWPGPLGGAPTGTRPLWPEEGEEAGAAVCGRRRAAPAPPGLGFVLGFTIDDVRMRSDGVSKPKRRLAAGPQLTGGAAAAAGGRVRAREIRAAERVRAAAREGRG